MKHFITLIILLSASLHGATKQELLDHAFDNFPAGSTDLVPRTFIEPQEIDFDLSFKSEYSLTIDMNTLRSDFKAIDLSIESESSLLLRIKSLEEENQKLITLIKSLEARIKNLESQKNGG